MFKLIQKWFHRRGLLGAIAKNAMEQYFKWKLKDENLTEAEVAKNIFIYRYTNPNGIFDANEKIKITKYISSSFLPENLVEFCLISLDIEGNINPMDGKTYTELSGWLEEFLVYNGYPTKEQSELDIALNKLDPHSLTVSQFNVKWYERIRMNRSSV